VVRLNKPPITPAPIRKNSPVENSVYKYNASDDGLAEYLKCFTSRNGDGSGDHEENFLSCLKLVAYCKSGCEFLDVGSGHGRIVDIIRPYAAHVVALEPDTERFRSCRNGFLGVHNVDVHNTVSSEYRVANPEKKFDVITLSMVQQHISTRQSQDILEDIRDLLAPDGLAIISTTHFFDERFLYQGRFVPVSMNEFDRYAEDTSNQAWGIPVRMFSKKSFHHAILRASLKVIMWNQFSYLRPEKVEAFANQYSVPADAIRDIGYSQFAVVKSASSSNPAAHNS